jgi:hypothetical protein
MFNYLLKYHGMNSTLLKNLSNAPEIAVYAYIEGKKVRKNYRDQIDLAVFRFLLEMKDTSPELEELLQ